MKKSILSVVFIVLTISIINAQDLQFSPFAGYTFADKFGFYKGSAKIGDGFTYGGILSYVIEKKVAIELTYSRQDCDVFAYSDYHNIDIDGPISSNYIFLGSNKLFPVNEDAALFFGANLGLGVYSGKENDIGTTTKFAAGLNGGVKYFFSDIIGVRLMATLNMPITDVSGGFWWSSGGGTSIGLSSNIPFLQFGFMGGLVFNLN